MIIDLKMNRIVLKLKLLTLLNVNNLTLIIVKTQSISSLMLLPTSILMIHKTAKSILHLVKALFLSGIVRILPLLLLLNSLGPINVIIVLFHYIVKVSLS